MADRTVRVRLEAAVEGFRSAMRQSKQDTETFRSSVRDNAQELRTLGVAATAMGVAASAGIRAVLTSGMEYQASMNQVRAVTGATGQQMEQLSGQARELGATTKFSASEAADAMYFLASAGFDTNQVLAAMPGVLQLAAAGNMDLATTADIASNILSGYAMDVSELGRVNDVLAVTFTNTNTNIAQAGDAMKYVAPVASAAGLAFEETAAAVGLLGNAGIQGSMAGTTLRGVITALLNPTGEAAAILERLGVNALDSSGNMVPLADIVEQLGESGATTGELMQVFGQRAGPGLAALIAQGADALRDQTQAGLESAGTAADIAAIQMEGLQGAVTELGSAWEGLKISLFEAGSGDFAEGVVRQVTSVVQALEAAPPAAQATVMGIAGVTAVFGTLGGGALILLPRIVSTMDAVAQLGGVATITRRTLGGVASFVTGPWGMAMVAGGLAIAEFTRRQAEAQAAAQTLQGHLDEVAAGAEALGDAFLVNEMKSKGVYHTWEQLGIPLDTLRGALRGVPEDIAVVEGALQANRSTWDDISDATNRVTMGLIGSQDQHRELHRVLASLGIATEEYLPLLEEQERRTRSNEAASARLTGQAELYGVELGNASRATGDFTGALDDNEMQAQDTRSAIERLTDSLNEMIGVNITAERAAIRLAEGYDRLTDEIEGGSDALDINTEKGRNNRSMIMDQIDATLTAMQAEYDRTGSMAAVADMFDTHVVKLRDVLRQAGLTEDQIDGYIETLGFIPENVITEIIANNNTDTVFDRVMQRIGAIPRLIPVEVRITQTGSSVAHVGSNRTVQHAGGWAGSGPMRASGIAHDEIPAILKQGEFVVRDDVAARYGPMLEALNGRRFHDGGWVGHDGGALMSGDLKMPSTVVVEVPGLGESFVGLVRTSQAGHDLAVASRTRQVRRQRGGS